MADPWAPPEVAGPWSGPGESTLDYVPTRCRLSVRSVPDGRAPVPLVWWVVLVAVLALATTTVAVLPGRRSDSRAEVIAAVVVSIVGYLAVWWRIRPARLRTGPHPPLPPPAMEPLDRSDPPTIVLPAVRAAGRWAVRPAVLLVNSAAVAMGFSALWSLLTELVLRPKPQPLQISSTVVNGFVVSVLDAVGTSILEECGIAMLVLAVAGMAQRYLPVRWDSRSVAITAIATGTLARTLLHIPLWGLGAVGRIGLSFALAWLFWRTRRIWPLIVAHVLWDTLAIQAAISPSLTVKSFCALAIVGWGISGVTFAVIALNRGRPAVRKWA